jgi:hypothetical protein
MKNLLLLVVLLLSFNSVNAQCNKIMETKDGFTDEVTYRYRNGNTSISKYVGADSTKNTYLYLTAKSTYLTSPDNGVILLFEDGSKFNLPNETIDYSSGSGGYWNYTAFISITDELNAKLLESELVAFKLYIFDAKTKAGKDLSIVLKCLNTK